MRDIQAHGNKREREITDSQKNDLAMIARLQSGDEQAFEQIYLRWHKPVRSFLYKITRSLVEAEDIAQDVFVYLWNDREQMARYNNIRKLVFLIATRRAVDASRRAGYYGDYLARLDARPGLDISPDQIVEAEETRLLTEIAIQHMPDRQREVFMLHYNEDLSAKEIADRLGVSYESVRKHIYNGKKYIEGLIAVFAIIFIEGG